MAVIIYLYVKLNGNLSIIPMLGIMCNVVPIKLLSWQAGKTRYLFIVTYNKQPLQQNGEVHYTRGCQEARICDDTRGYEHINTFHSAYPLCEETIGYC